MEPARFEWDKGNANKNFRRLRVTDRECEEAFFDPRFLVFYDRKHSMTEERYYGMGKTLAGRLLFVVFTIRQDKVRVISARNINRKERSYYEKV